MYPGGYHIENLCFPVRLKTQIVGIGFMFSSALDLCLKYCEGWSH